MDEDYYILTLAAIARELSKEQINQANVYLAAGLPLSWVAKQRKAFQEYLLQNREVAFSFRRKNYHIRIVGAAVYPQGFAAIAPIGNHFTGSNMLCDIGNGTMNILRTMDSKVDLRQMFTEKYGVQQCVLAVQETLMREHHAELDEQRYGTVGIDEELEKTMNAKKVFRKLREHGYDPRIMKLYVVGGGGCLPKNFFPIAPDKIIINSDICATAKGYEFMADVQNVTGGVK